MRNGAGKSTTIRMILGLAPADCGRVAQGNFTPGLPQILA
jgi:ABC-type multidrug transport system ATPase subunit